VSPAPSEGTPGGGEKLSLAIIGAGGRGWDNIKGVRTEDIVALCDVDDRRAQKAFAEFPQARRYKDFRELLIKETAIDGVVISTPDHTHAVAALAAMRAGRHVYCEKPLTHTIGEARLLRETAARHRCITQLGTQGHSEEGTFQAVEAIRAGAIGDVKEVHVWSDRPAGWWPQGVARPKDKPPVPPELDWDLWLGPAPQRPFHPDYVPFKWRGFYDFGTGAIGDMGVHNLNTAFWALELGLPTSAEVVESGPMFPETPPVWSVVDLHFPARGRRPAVKVRWYDGGRKPPADLFLGEPAVSNGSLVIGSSGTLYTRTWHGGSNEKDWFLLLPRKTYADWRPAGKTIPRRGHHHADWIVGVKSGTQSSASFAYASVLTEALLVGQLAVRSQRKILWDAEKMRVTNHAPANAWVAPRARRGWTV
jgi:predicted dehydrogenase